MNATAIAQSTSSNFIVSWVEICKIIMSIVGVVGNSLVCLIFISVKRMRTITNCFIVSLAFTDLISSILILPFPVPIPVPSGVAGELYCRLVFSRAFLWISFKASVFNLVAVTVERYYAIVHPVIHIKVFTKKTCFVMVVMVWFCACAVESIAFYIFVYDKEGNACAIWWPSEEYRKAIAVLLYLASFLIPTIVLIFVYVKILSSLKHHAILLHQNHESEHSPSLSLLKTREKIIKMLFLVVVTFFICWAPNQTLFLAFNFGAPLDHFAVYYQFFILLAFCNSCMNPIIYSFKNKQFRDGLKLIFGKNSGQIQPEHIAPFHLRVHTVTPQGSSAPHAAFNTSGSNSLVP
ncbi:galanin receptor type 1-like [Saccoglossus kowalevskii]